MSFQSPYLPPSDYRSSILSPFVRSEVDWSIPLCSPKEINRGSTFVSDTFNSQ